MKLKLILSTFTILAVISTPASGKIWRLDNSVGAVDADFITLQAAHDSSAVTSGDTLYVYGCNTNYGSLTTYKRLFIFGPGYFLDENPNTQDNTRPAACGTIAFNAGSEGSLITGMTTGIIQISTDNVTIDRNYVRSTTPPCISISSAMSGILIQSNYLYNSYCSSGYGRGIAFAGNNSSIFINNNYIDCCYSILIPLTCSSIHVSNNVLEGHITLNNTVFQNNILRGGDYSGDLNSVFNNICNETQFDTTGSNQQNVDMNTVFVGTGSTDGQLQIKEGGPADGAGFNDVDCGIFGGSTPYVLSGIPAIPAIYYLSVRGTGTSTTGLQVWLKGKSRI